MKIYDYDKESGLYLGESMADADPLDKANWLIPSNATNLAPLEMQDGKTVNFINGKWVYIDIPATIVEPIAFEPQKTYQEKRISEYPPFMDYIDGLVKNDQEQMQTYIDACLAVKAKYPKE